MTWKGFAITSLDEQRYAMSMEFCSRFDACSAPKCPLDPFIDVRIEIEGDPKCGMAKATRHKYWESMPEDLKLILPYEGYFRLEFNRMAAARERWNRMSDSAKENLKSLGRKALEKSRMDKR